MAKFIFNNTDEGIYIPDSISIEADDEEKAWKRFEEKIINPIRNAFTCSPDLIVLQAELAQERELRKELLKILELALTEIPAYIIGGRQEKVRNSILAAIANAKAKGE